MKSIAARSDVVKLMTTAMGAIANDAPLATIIDALDAMDMQIKALEIPLVSDTAAACQHIKAAANIDAQGATLFAAKFDSLKQPTTRLVTRLLKRGSAADEAMEDDPAAEFVPCSKTVPPAVQELLRLAAWSPRRAFDSDTIAVAPAALGLITKKESLTDLLATCHDVQERNAEGVNPLLARAFSWSNVAVEPGDDATVPKLCELVNDVALGKAWFDEIAALGRMVMTTVSKFMNAAVACLQNAASSLTALLKEAPNAPLDEFLQKNKSQEVDAAFTEGRKMKARVTKLASNFEGGPLAQWRDEGSGRRFDAGQSHVQQTCGRPAPWQACYIACEARCAPT